MNHVPVRLAISRMGEGYRICLEMNDYDLVFIDMLKDGKEKKTIPIDSSTTVYLLLCYSCCSLQSGGGCDPLHRGSDGTRRVSVHI